MKVRLTRIGAKALAMLAACCAFGAPRADAGEEKPWYEHYTRPSVAPEKPQTAPGGRFFWQRPSAGAHQVERFITDLGACRLPDDTGKFTRRTSINEWWNAGTNTAIDHGLIEFMLHRMESDYDGLRVVTDPMRSELKELADRKPPDEWTMRRKVQDYMKLYDRVREWCDRLEAFDGRGSLVPSARFLQKEFPNDFSCNPARLEAELAQLHRSWQEKTQGLDLGRPESAAMLAAGAADYMKARDTVRFGLFGLAAYVARHDVVDLKDEWRRQWDVTSEQMSDYVTGAEYGEWQHASSLLARQSVAANRDLFKIEKIRRGTLCPEALIDDSMRTPVDVLLVRLSALAAELRENPKTGTAKLKPLEKRLASIRQAARKVPEDLRDARQALFFALCRIQREMAFLNPLLDFNRLLFIKHPHPHFYQWSIFQFLGTTAVGGGGLFVLDDCFSQKPVLRDLVAETECETGRLKGRKLVKGDFLSPELSWDGKTVYFAYTEHANGLVRPEPDEAYRAKRTANPLYKTGGGGMAEEDYLETIRTTESCYHVFSVGADGKGLRQLTDGPVNDFDPVELPNVRIAFVSERRGGFGRSSSTRAYTLHTMEPDGSDIVRISHHEQNEFQPSVDHDGLILYTRWDTWDRNYEMPQGMWTTFPDGRDARAPLGNYVFGNEVFVPTGVNDLRAVPGSRKIMGLESTYSDYFYGSVVLVDPTVPEHGSHPDKFKRLTPDQGWGHASMERTRYGGPCRYTTPWPLSERFFLCAYDDQARMNTGPLNRYAVYLADAFGNRVLLYRDPAIACQSPMPLQARSRPPVIPHQTAIGKPRRAAADGAQGGASSVDPSPVDPRGVEHAGTAPVPAAVAKVNLAHPISAAVGGMAEVGVMNIYTAALPFPKGTRITALRIIQTAAKTVAGRNNPVIGYGHGYGWDKGGRMVLGTVPVEEDGSAYFTMPAGVPVYFQAVDDQGLAVQTMRTTSYAQPGERLICLGCHEPRERTGPPTATNIPLALKRAPSAIAPDIPESNPLTFPRLVQPVLDKHCVSCHNPKEGHKRASDRKDRYCFEYADPGRAAIEPVDCKKPDLTAGDWRQGQRIQHGNDEKLDLVGTEYWFTSYKNLGRYVKGFWGHQGDGPPETRPGTYLARESPLYQHLKRGHKDVKLSADEMHRLVLWMDCNSMFYCATTDLYKQAAGEVVLPEHE